MRDEEDVEDGLYRKQETRLQSEQFMETQSSESSEQAVIHLLDSADNNTVSNLSSEFEKDSELQKDEFEHQLEPSAPYMPPSPSDDGGVRSPTYDSGDRFDDRQLELHASSFDGLYIVGTAPGAAAFEGEGESDYPAASSLCWCADIFLLGPTEFVSFLLLCMPLLLHELPSVIKKNACGLSSVKDSSQLEAESNFSDQGSC